MSLVNDPDCSHLYRVSCRCIEHAVYDIFRTVLSRNSLANILFERNIQQALSQKIIHHLSLAISLIGSLGIAVTKTFWTRITRTDTEKHGFLMLFSV